MKGIREAAMSSETEETPVGVPARKSPSLFDKDFDSDRYDGSYYGSGYGYGSGYSQKSYKKEDPNRFVCTFFIPIEELGEIADESSLLYNWDKAQIKAEEAAYDRLTEIFGKGYESKWSVSFEVVDGYTEYEVAVTLTPTK